MACSFQSVSEKASIGDLSELVGSVWRPRVLRLLGNESRLRILLALARHEREGSLTVYKLAKVSGLERKVIQANLRPLVAADWVGVKSYGPIHVHYLRRDHFVVSALLEFFRHVRLLDLDASSVTGYS